MYVNTVRCAKKKSAKPFDLNYFIASLNGSVYGVYVLIRKCFNCNKTKTADYFYKRKTKNADGNYLHAYCIDCEDQDTLDFFVPTNRKTDRFFYLNQYKLGRYVETRLKRFNKLMRSQGGRCAICKRWTHPKPLCVDHDHATGKVRGLLCTRCNVRLGKWHDKPPTHETKFITYLSK